MQKSKLFILAVVGLSLVANTLPGAFSSSTSSLSGTNVDLEYVYTDDGDTVTLRGWCERPGLPRIGFGECVGTVLAADA